MTLSGLLKRAGIVAEISGRDVKITGVVCDSRQVEPGSLFVAVPGVLQDGLEYVDDACRRGAAAVISEVELTCGVSSVKVPDAHEALAKLCCTWHDNPSYAMKMVGITGTNGKSTVSYLLHSILSAAGKRAGLIGTVQYLCGERRIPATRTTPDAVELQRLLAEMKRDQADYVVMEVSSHGLVQKRVDGVLFDVAVFTNLSRDHLDYHGDMERYFAAKRSLFEQLLLNPEGVAVVNVSDQWGCRLLEWCLSHGQKCLTFSLSDGDCSEKEIPFGDAGWICAYNLDLSPEGAEFSIKTPWGDCDISTPLMGRYNVENAVAAIAAGGILGMSLEGMVSALSGTIGAPGRLERIESGRGIDIFVDYAHTGDALKKALHALRESLEGRLIVVFGCGGDRDRGKRPEMGLAAAEGADILVLTSDNPRREDPNQILSDVVKGIPDYAVLYVEPDRRSAIRMALSLAKKGDTLLVAGKGHETTQVVGGLLLEFDDREEVRRALQDE